MDKRDLAAGSRTVEAMGPVLVRQSRVLDQAMRSAAEVAEALPPMEDVRAMAAAVEALPPMETVREVAAVTEVLPRMEVVRPMASITGEFSRTMTETVRPMASISEAALRGMNEALRPMASIWETAVRSMNEALRPMASISEAALRGMNEALRPMASISEAALRGMNEALRPMASISEAALRSITETVRPATTLLIRLRESLIAFYRSLKARAIQLAARMRSDPRPELTNAGDCFESAWDVFGEGIISGRISGDESYEARDAIRDVVGAIEELVCQIAHAPTTTLPKAVKRLVRRGVLSEAQGQETCKMYDIRSSQRGVAHGAGRVPNKMAWRVLLDSVPIVCTILDAADIGTDRDPELDGRVEWAALPALV